MKRTIVVSLSGVLLCVLVASMSAYLIVNYTSHSNVLTGNPAENTDWGRVERGLWTLFILGTLPAAIITGAFVGYFEKRFPIGAALVSTSPVTVLDLEFTSVSIIFTLCTLFVVIIAAHAVHRLTSSKHIPTPSSSGTSVTL